MSRREIRRLATLAAVLLAVLLWLSGAFHRRIRSGEIEAPPGPAPSALARVEASREPALESASGTLVSARHTTVSSNILARIEDVRVRAGADVTEGQVLLVLDARDLAARLQEARDALTAARATRALAASERLRAERLFEAGVASRQALDRALSADRVAEAEVQRASQRAADAEIALSHAEIRSPVTGRVIDRLAEPGDTATPGRPLLRIYDPGALRLEASVRESLAQHLRVGQPLSVRVEALNERFEGRLEEIVPWAEPGARSFIAKIQLPADRRLFAGMFGRVEIPAGEITRLRVPAAAVEHIGQLELVTVLAPSGQTERRFVTTGTLDDRGRVEVLSGLSAGEQVVLPRAE
jgi:RND family efflux transporter MFP subunit